MKVFLDSNIFLRYLVPENPSSHNECTAIIGAVENGQLVPYISNIVIQEILYSLIRIYKFDKKTVLSWLSDLMNLRNLVLIEKTNTPKSVALYKKYSMKFGDCLIAVQIPKGTILCTYDTDFAKLPHLTSGTPHHVLASLKGVK